MGEVLLERVAENQKEPKVHYYSREPIASIKICYFLGGKYLDKAKLNAIESVIYHNHEKFSSFVSKITKIFSEKNKNPLLFYAVKSEV